VHKPFLLAFAEALRVRYVFLRLSNLAFLFSGPRAGLV
jgi:hypothetical protein